MFNFYNYFVLIITIVFFIISSYEDIKKREVYFYYTYSYIFIILIISLINSLLTNNFISFRYEIFGLITGYIIGGILFYLGVWGGGDLILLIGLYSAFYYLIPFFKNNITNIANLIFFKIKNLIFIKWINLFFYKFLEIFFYFNLLFLSLIFIITLKNLYYQIKYEKGIFKKFIKDVFVILLLFYISIIEIYYNSTNNFLYILGLISFVIILTIELFLGENTFNSIYILYEKKVSNLKRGDLLYKNIIHNGKKLISDESFNYGLDEYDIEKLKTALKKDSKIKLKHVFPISKIIHLNLLIYILKLIVLNSYTILYFLYELKYILFSIIVGGIFTIIFILYNAFKFRKRIKLKWNHLDYLILIFILIPSILMLISHKYILFFMLLSLLLMYLLIKIGREIESLIFVKFKKIEEIVPGDWLIKDVKIKNKIIYKNEDFKQGIDENQIKVLKKLINEKKLENKFLVKDGIAFYPFLFLGLLLLFIF